MEHAQPLDRSFPWRGIGLAVALVLVIAAAALGGMLLLHRLDRTRPVSDTGHVPQGQTATRHKAPPATPMRARTAVSVLVQNGNGVNHAAETVATRLLARHYRRATAEDAANHAYARSIVLFRRGYGREAVRLMRDAHAATVAPLDGHLPAADNGYALILILGKN